MLKQDEVLKLEMKLKENKLNGKKPTSKKELAELLGTTRQQIWYCCFTEKVNSSKHVEEKLREWLKI